MTTKDLVKARMKDSQKARVMVMLKGPAKDPWKVTKKDLLMETAKDS